MQKIIDILKENGPLSGKELFERSRTDSLSIWRTCIKSKKITTKIIGKRYLRLDRHVEGYARLSPSILREFLTYTIIGLDKDIVEIKKKAEELNKEIVKVSNEKFNLSKEIISRIVESQINNEEIKKKATFIIAGDIVYNMAHRDPRPESSTGMIVNGSDLDIIIVTDNISDNIIKELDHSIYNEKYYLLKMPAYREEIDYIIKDITRVKKQSEFNSFEFMVASKILNEGKLLFGSKKLFENIKRILKEKNISQKIKKLEENAIKDRKKAKSHLLRKKVTLLDDDYKKLFFTTEETEEIF